MKLSFEIFKLTLFFSYSFAICFQTTKEIVSFDIISPEKAKLIFNNLQNIEQNWTKKPTTIKQLPLSLRKLVKQTEIEIITHELWQAYITNNLKEFQKKRDEIYRVLRPILLDAAREARQKIIEVAKQAKQKENQKQPLGWLDWLKSNMTSFKKWILRRIS